LAILIVPGQAMRPVNEHLIRRKEQMVLLLTPPYDQSKPRPGYIMGYPPGVRENGGQFTHASVWVAMAYARMGAGARAVEVLQMLNPVEHARTANDYAVYRTEPLRRFRRRVLYGGPTWSRRLDLVYGLSGLDVSGMAGRSTRFQGCEAIGSQ